MAIANGAGGWTRSASHWLTGIAVAMALTVPFYAMASERSWLAPLLWPLSPIYWLAVSGWAVCIGCVLRWQRQWWLLLTALPVLYPVGLLGCMWILLAGVKDI